MKPIQFISNSVKIDSIIKGLTLTKSLMVSSILIGEPNTGKKTLVSSLFPSALFVDAKNYEELESAMTSKDEIIIYNFEAILNVDKLNFDNKKIIAIANSVSNSFSIENKFAFIYQMPTLAEREDDIMLIVEHFITSISKELMIGDESIFSSVDISSLDISKNLKSLRASIYKKLVTHCLSADDIEDILFGYLYEQIDGNNAYREHIGIYEKPLIKAGLKKYKSQLKLSSALGLNRNTLRKKIYEHNID